MTDDFQTKLRKLAELSVRFGLNIQPGQELFISAPTAALQLVRLISEEAYKAGATAVIPFFADDEITLAKFRSGSEAAIDHAPAWLFEALGAQLKTGKTARLAIAGDTPGLLADQDPGRVARASRAQSTASRPFLDAIVGNHTNWNIVPFVTPGWAAKVFADDAPDAAEARLWRHVFRATRVDQPDPVAAWRENFAELYRRRDALNAADFSALHFTGGGTDLTVGLAAGHRWIGGGMTRGAGIEYAPNLPTEEVFTMPDRNRTEGRAVFTKPAAIAGTIVEGLVVEFSDGKATRISADSGEEVARQYFTTDEGASRLGEVALVSNSSPIAASGTLFLNTLFDENAGCHIAFGNAYEMNLREGVKDKAAMNKSQIHHDCMIGHAALDVTGMDRQGRQVPVMRGGEFVI